VPERELVLHMFLASHYNEKARWALDWKRLAHRRIPYLPGPHAPQIQRLSGQRATPVLVMDGRAIAGSALIIDALEREFPAHPLLPVDPALRERALGVQRQFDDEVGTAVCTVLFSVLLRELGYLRDVFAAGQPALKRGMYRALLPLVKPLIAQANDVSSVSVPRAFARTEQALEETARLIGPSGQIAGDAFSVADLTAAALLAPLSPPAHPDMARPARVPARVQELYARYERHAAVQWLHEQYAKHRPAPCAVAAQ
jgi:glutathione S-transferase